MRYKLKMLLATSVSVLALSSAYGGQEQASKFKHQFNLGLEVQHYHYKEPDIEMTDDGMAWMEQKARMGGINGSYRFTWQDKFFVQPEARILWGKENYKTGEGDKYIDGLKHKVPDLIFETRLISGGHVNLSKSWIVSPYSGIGYRLKIDDGEKVKETRGSYAPYRKSNYLYAPVGAYVTYKVSDSWSVSAKGEYDYLIKGWQYSRPYRTQPVEFKQKSGYGLKGEIAVSYDYNEKLSVYFSPYIHYWHIKDSALAIYDRQEPKNSTIESGVRLGISF